MKLTVNPFTRRRPATAARAGTATPGRVVTVYSRPGCGLCEEALQLVRRLAPSLRCTVEEIDIDRDPALLAAYDSAVPVVTVHGVEAGRAPLDPRALRARLAALLG